MSPSEPVTAEKPLLQRPIVTKLQMVHEFAKSNSDEPSMTIQTNAVVALSELALAAIAFADAFFDGVGTVDAGRRLDAAIAELEKIP